MQVELCSGYKHGFGWILSEGCETDLCEGV